VARIDEKLVHAGQLGGGGRVRQPWPHACRHSRRRGFPRPQARHRPGRRGGRGRRRVGPCAVRRGRAAAAGGPLPRHPPRRRRDGPPGAGPRHPRGDRGGGAPRRRGERGRRGRLRARASG
jgi:hypothetical protein